MYEVSNYKETLVWLHPEVELSDSLENKWQTWLFGVPLVFVTAEASGAARTGDMIYNKRSAASPTYEFSGRPFVHPLHDTTE